MWNEKKTRKKDNKPEKTRQKNIKKTKIHEHKHFSGKTNKSRT